MDELQLLETKRTMTSLEIAEITGKRHDNVLADIRDEIKKLGANLGLLIFQETSYINEQNKQTYPMFVLTSDGVLQLAARYDAVVRFKLIKAVRNKTYQKIQLEDTRIKESEIYLKLAELTSNEKYKETLIVLSTNKLNGSEVLSLPKVDKKSYTATEIGNKLGITSMKVGSIAKKHNLKTEEFGFWAYDKAKHSNKQVESFRYYENVINELKKYI